MVKTGFEFLVQEFKKFKSNHIRILTSNKHLLSSIPEIFNTNI